MSRMSLLSQGKFLLVQWFMRSSIRKPPSSILGFTGFF